MDAKTGGLFCVPTGFVVVVLSLQPKVRSPKARVMVPKDGSFTITLFITPPTYRVGSRRYEEM